MKVRRLKLQNYRRYHDVELELPDGVIAIIGRNGSGKSTLIEAIAFAFYGAAAARTPKALLRNSDAPPGDPVSVTVELELGGQALVVERQLRGENLTPKASLTVDGQPLVQAGANSNAAVTEEMERLLGMDRHAFFTTIVAPQKDLARLADLPATERKQLILRMLGIDAIDRAVQKARDEGRTATARLEGLRAQMDDPVQLKAALKEAQAAAKTAAENADAITAQHGVSSQNLEAAKLHLEAVQNEAQARAKAEQEVASAKLQLDHASAQQANAEQELLQITAALTALAKLGTNLPDVTSLETAKAQATRWHEAHTEVAALQAQLVEVPPATDITLLEQDANNTHKAWQGALQNLASVEGQLQHLRNQMRRLEGADPSQPCPVCQRAMDEHLPTVKHATQAQFDQLQEAHNAAKGHAAALEKLAKAAATSLQAAVAKNQQHAVAAAAQQSSRQRLEQLKPLCEGSAPDSDALEAELAKARTTHAEANRLQAITTQGMARQAAATQASNLAAATKARWQDATAYLATLPPAPDVAAAKQKFEQEHSTERQLFQQRHSAFAALALAGKTVEHANANLARWMEAKARAEAAELDVRTWSALAGGRGRGMLEQFRSHMVGRIRPAINQEASRLLAMFTNGRYTEMLLDDDYGLYVRDQGVAYTVSRFSGGETDLVHLALRLAVSRLLAQRSGAPELRFLALDEVFGSLDDDRQASVLATLHSLSGLYSQVLLVTHHEGLRDALDGVIHVQATEAGTTLHQG